MSRTPMTGASEEQLIARLRRLGELRHGRAQASDGQGPSPVAGRSEPGLRSDEELPPAVTDATLLRLLQHVTPAAEPRFVLRDWLAVAVPAGLAATIVGATFLPPSAADQHLAPRLSAGSEALLRLLERIGELPR